MSSRSRHCQPRIKQAHGLDLLTAEFDALFESQQTAAARAGMKRAFASTTRRMGKIAVAAARKTR
jgi:hypothetical protein